MDGDFTAYVKANRVDKRTITALRATNVRNASTIRLMTRLEHIMPENQPVILFQHSCTLSPLFSKNQPIILMKKK